MTRTTIIAEAGVNHDGSLEVAHQLIDVAADAGADIVKFQTFSATRLASRIASKAEYQKVTTAASESQLAMLQKLELDANDHRALLSHARERGIEFLSSPFDIESLKLLTDQLGLQRIKLGSGEVTNAPLLYAVGKSGRAAILSTGMATLEEVELALAVMAAGYLGRKPGMQTFSAIMTDPQAQAVLRDKVTLLHCTTQYPAPPSDANLAAMTTLRQKFGLPVGYSDHCLGSAISIAAVALGATVIEKHFTLDKTRPGPDHSASLEPHELKDFVTALRSTEASLGDGVKKPMPSEIPNIPIARKSIVAARDIAAGTTLTEQDITTKRPGHGKSPFLYWDVLGTQVTVGVKEDDTL